MYIFEEERAVAPCKKTRLQTMSLLCTLYSCSMPQAWIMLKTVSLESIDYSLPDKCN
jgi:hypothetical protein